MKHVSGIDINPTLQRYINGGLRLEYIAVERERLLNEAKTNQNDKNYTTPLVNTARRLIENRIKSGEILIETKTNVTEQVQQNILDFLKTHKQDDLEQVNKTFQELEF